MKITENKLNFLNRTTIAIVGVLLLLISSVFLLWHGNANSMQATSALVAQVYFDGEYRIADGPWQKIVEGEHISSTHLLALLPMSLRLFAECRLLPLLYVLLRSLSIVFVPYLMQNYKKREICKNHIEFVWFFFQLLFCFNKFVIYL